VTPSHFVYTVCQVGAEKALKEEMARIQPELRFAFSRPGFVTFKMPEGKPADGAWNPGSVFARSYGVSLGKGTDITNQLHALHGHAGSKLRLHVWERDQHLPGDEPPDFEQGPAAEALEARLRREYPGVFLDGAQAHEGETVFDVVLIERESADHPAEIWWGWHMHTKGRSPFPGARPPLVQPPEAPSRAWLKLEEMNHWLGGPLRAGDIAVEVGSAPGGMTHAMLERGLKVVGIDPGRMDERVMAHPRFIHIAEPVNAVLRERLPDEIDWILLDMNVKPDISLFAIDRLVSRVGDELLGVLLTVKLNDWKYAREIPSMVRHVQAMGLKHVRAAQLASHRREIAIGGLTRRGMMRLGMRLSQE
jgi:23S rRNA (cytidine2498-2'-O)-methyltransferase